MEVTSIQNGIIIDHVPAGTALKVLEYLKIDPAKTKPKPSTLTCSALWHAPQPSALCAAVKS